MSSALIDPPPTALAAEVARLLDEHAPVVRRHCERSYQFAAAFAKADGVDLDDEVLYLGTVLHDIGLVPGGDGSARFEVRGANVVRTLLLDRGMGADRVANVWDCIAMHASSALARHKSPETPAVLEDEVRAHPDTTRMSWLEPIATAAVPGFAPTDFLATIHASEAFC